MTTPQNPDDSWAPPLAPPATPAITTPLNGPGGADGSRTRSNPRWFVLAGIGIVAVLLIVAAAAVLLRSGGGDDTDWSAGWGVTIADAMEPKFTIDTARVTGGFGRLNAVIGNSVNQYDEDGNERWSHPFPVGQRAVALFTVVDGLVPVGIDDTNESRIVFLDEGTGESVGTGIEYAMSDGELPVVMADRFYLISDETIELYDPASGELLASVATTRTGPHPQGYLIAATANGTSVYDYDLQPLLSDVDVEFDGSLTYSDHKVITVESGSVVAYDENGQAWSTPTGMADLDSAESIGADRWILHTTSDEVAIVTGVGGDEVETIWQTSNASYVSPVSADRIFISRDDANVLIDRDGNELVEIEGTGSFFADNGLVLPRRADDRISFTGVDFDGNELWTIESDPSTTVWMQLSIVDRAVFDPGNNTVYGPK